MTRNEAKNLILQYAASDLEETAKHVERVQADYAVMRAKYPTHYCPIKPPRFEPGLLMNFRDRVVSYRPSEWLGRRLSEQERQAMSRALMDLEREKRIERIAPAGDTDRTLWIRLIEK
jgi:hypothetical protein